MMNEERLEKIKESLKRRKDLVNAPTYGGNHWPYQTVHEDDLKWLVEQAEQNQSNMNSLISKVRQWAIERDLHNADPIKQMLKLGEEFGELCEGLAKNNRDLVIDSIGDMQVVLINTSMQLGLDYETCLQIAYDEIKDRKGKMIDGVFVKEEDL